MEFKTIHNHKEEIMIVPNYFENPHFLHENTMPKRAYYIPASKFMHITEQLRKNTKDTSRCVWNTNQTSSSMTAATW